MANIMDVPFELKYVGEVDDDENTDAITHDGRLWGEGRTGRVSSKFVSDLHKLRRLNQDNVKDWAKKGVTPNTSKDLTIQPMSCGFTGVGGVVNMIDTIDRTGTADANSTYARAGTYATGGTNKPGERIPKAGAFAEVGLGEANAKWSIFEAFAKGPNAGASAGATVTGASAMATAGLGTASAQAGPVGVKIGLQLDTGASIGVDGIEAKILGIGFSLGPKTSFSLFGNEVSINLL